MATSITITLADHWHRYVEGTIANRRFGSIDEAVEAGLRALEAEEAHFDWLERALAEGERSGDWREWDYDAFRAEMRSGADDREAA